MSVEPQALERSVLERKERDELAAIAEAMGVKAGSRTSKANLIGQILREAGIETAEDKPKRAAKAKGENGETEAASAEQVEAAAGTNEKAATEAGEEQSATTEPAADEAETAEKADASQQDSAEPESDTGSEQTQQRQERQDRQGGGGG